MKRYLLLALLALGGCKPATSPPAAPSTTAAAPGPASVVAVQTDEERFYVLTGQARAAFNDGKYDEAKTNAEDLQKLTPKFAGNWNYGNAVQNSNLVLGRLAVRTGDLESAKKYLLAAGNGPGSPQMNSFGPNMSLAQDLIAKGEKDSVVAYFDACRSFWRMDAGRLDRWTADVRAGQMPKFGANLLY